MCQCALCVRPQAHGVNGQRPTTTQPLTYTSSDFSTAALTVDGVDLLQQVRNLLKVQNNRFVPQWHLTSQRVVQLRKEKHIHGRSRRTAPSITASLL